MTRKTRRTLVCALSALLLAALAGASVASALTSHTVNVLGHGSQTGIKLTATYKGTPFGTCKMTGTLVIPDTHQTWRCTRGSFKLIGHGTTGAANNAKGTWRIVRGSGTRKYRHISGKGTFAGKLSTGTFRYKGTAKY